jgi:hypothetical protein
MALQLRCIAGGMPLQAADAQTSLWNAALCHGGALVTLHGPPLANWVCVRPCVPWVHLKRQGRCTCGAAQARTERTASFAACCCPFSVVKLLFVLY